MTAQNDAASNKPVKRHRLRWTLLILGGALLVALVFNPALCAALMKAPTAPANGPVHSTTDQPTRKGTEDNGDKKANHARHHRTGHG